MLSHRRVISLLAPLALSAGACSCEGEGDLRALEAKLEVSSERIDFGEVPVSDLRVRGLTLKNAGNVALELTKVELTTESGEFAIQSNAPAALGPQESVDLTLVFEPDDVGEELATLVVDSNDGKGPKTITLRGVGVLGGVAVSHDGEPCGDAPDSISFGAIAPNNTVTRSVTLRSAGTAAFRVLSAVIAPGTSTEFSIEGVAEGGSTLAPGEDLVLTARYTPIDGGTDSGEIVITTDLAERPSIRLAICGEGIAPAICARPVPLDFGAVATGARTTRLLTIESCGRETLELGALSIATDPAHPSNPGYGIATAPMLPQTLAPGESVMVEIAFETANIGQADGWLRAESNAPDAFFPLTARGALPCSLFIAPAQLTWTNVAPGTSQAQTLLVANDGASSCNVTRLEVTTGATEFRLAAGTPATLTLASGGSTSIEVEYAPGAAGPHTGTLELEGNGAIVPVALNGDTTLPGGCQLEVVPTIVNFGGVAPNTTRNAGVEVRNLSTERCRITNAELAAGSAPEFQVNFSRLSGTVFAQGTTNPLNGERLDVRTLGVTFVASSAGPKRGELVITTDDVDTPVFRVPLFAASAESGICVSPRLLPFGARPGVADMSFTITACGGNAVEVTGLDWTTADPEFALATPPALPFTLQAGASQQVTVRYSPADMQGDTAVVTVRSNDSVDPAIPVEATGGPEIVPTDAGRFLYYWSIRNPIAGGDIMKLPLQGATTAVSFWGPGSGKGCTGCHHVSPDGRYVALIEMSGSPFMKIIDTSTNLELQLPQDLRVSVSYFSWRPNVRTNPPYQFAYDTPDNSGASKVNIGSPFAGHLRELQGANDPAFSQAMPTWGSTGKIAFVRGAPSQMTQGGATGFNGPTDIMLVDENGGTPMAVAGASQNMGANYYPAFSPNGNWIAFTFSQSAQGTIAAADSQIRLVNANQSGSPLLLTSANSAGSASSYPTWSVDGAFLSFSSNRAGGAGDWDIYLAPIDPATGADGAAMNLRQANTPSFEHAAQWSP